MTYSVSVILPFSSRSWVRRIYPWFSSSFNAAPMLSTPSRQIAASPLVVSFHPSGRANITDSSFRRHCTECDYLRNTV